MKKIKFRAWDKDTKSMDYNPTIDGFEVGIVALNSFAYQHSSKIILMQYTGLKDKNGKDVYEGDLLKTNDRIVEVVWHEQCGGWDTNLVKYIGKRKSNGLDNAEWQFRAKIIGNIYENSELLGEQ